MSREIPYNELRHVDLAFKAAELTLSLDYEGDIKAYHSDTLKVMGATEEEYPFELHEQLVLDQADPFRKVGIRADMFKFLVKPGIKCDRNGRKPYEYRLKDRSLNRLMKKFTSPATDTKNKGATAADYLMDNNDPTKIQLSAFPENVREELLIRCMSAIKARATIPDLLEKCRPGGGPVGKEERIRYSTFWGEKREGGWLYNTGIVPRELKIQPGTYRKILARLSFACGYIPKFLKGYDKGLENWDTVEQAVKDIKDHFGNSDELIALSLLKTAEERMEQLKSMALSQSFMLAKFQNTVIASSILGLANEYRSIEDLTEHEAEEIEQFWGSFFGNHPRIPSLMTRKVRDDLPNVWRCSVSEAMEILKDARRIKGQVIKLVGYEAANLARQERLINFVNLHAARVCVYLPATKPTSKEKGILKVLERMKKEREDFFEIRWAEDKNPLISQFEFVEISDPSSEGMAITFNFSTEPPE